MKNVHRDKATAALAKIDWAEVKSNTKRALDAIEFVAKETVAGRCPSALSAPLVFDCLQHLISIGDRIDHEYAKHVDGTVD